ncbi:MAG: dihydrodipicolinate synthase family protein [Chlorobi bacterium]|nr:dihydrodipicolinate synthase family protein [Chlorobiota bacterium]
MKKVKEHAGVIVPMITPFTEDGKVDLDSVEKIIEKFIENDSFPFILGTTGEAASISNDEKRKFVKFVCEKFAGRTKVYAGAASNSVNETIENTKAFFDSGIIAVASHLPSYYPLHPYHMMKYYETLAEKAGGPIIVYNITATTHMSIPLDIVDQLSRHENIVGLKDSEHNQERLDKSIELWKDREDFSHLIGWGTKCFEGLAKGSDGIVPSTGNFSAKIYSDLYQNVLNDNLDEAAVIQKQTEEISAIYQKDRLLSEALAALKVMMKSVELCDVHVLPPLTNTSKKEAREIIMQTKEIVEKYNLI